MVAVGIAFIALIIVAGINTLNTEDSGVLGLGVGDEGSALAEFAVPEATSELSGDANIAQDDCESSSRPCPEGDVRTPACRVEGEGVIRVCDYFDKPLVLSFWFTRGGDCEGAQDTFEAVSRRYRNRVGFLAVNVRDPREAVRKLIEERGWTHTVGLDADGALSNLYRIGGCPTFLYVYPGGVLHRTSIGQLEVEEMASRVDELVAASERRAAG